MSSTTLQTPSPYSDEADSLIPTLELWPLSVDDYHLMADRQILLDGDPVELIDGFLVRKEASLRVPQLDRLSSWCDVLSRFGVSRMPIWHLSVDQYHEMLKVGILKSGDPVELINGLLVKRMTKNSGHRISTIKCREKLTDVVPDATHIQVQEPIRMDQGEPEPDVAVIRGAADDYPSDHPGPVNTLLIVEVSEASLKLDRTEKLELYARNQVAEYWIVNLIDRCVEVYNRPSGPTESPTFLAKSVYRPGQSIPIPWTDGTMLPVDDVLPNE